MTINNLPLAILNTSVLTADGSYTRETITVEEAQNLVHQAAEIDSAVGHESTAQALTSLLGIEIQVHRQQFAQKAGQQALVFQTLKRVEEGRVLSLEELDEIGYSLKLLTRTA